MSRNATILIVDDLPTNVKVLETILVREGFDVRIAGSAKEGLASARSAVPDLILLDVMMPEQSGFEMCGELKKDPVTSEIPVIFISALNDAASKVTGLSIGGQDYITKPFDRTEVLARVRVQLKTKAAAAEIIGRKSEKLNLVQETQRGILVRSQDIPEAGFEVFFRPAEEAGGDFFDVVKLGEGCFGYLAADVSGHDIGSSFVTFALKAVFQQNVGPLHAPEETLRAINRVIRTVLKDTQHLTACYAVLDRKCLEVNVVGAGHPPMVILRADGGAEIIETGGDILGVFDSVECFTQRIAVKSGDRLVLFSDGMIEWLEGEMVSREKGIEALVRDLEKYRRLPLKEMVEAVGEARCSLPPAQKDDLLLLSVEV